MDEPDFIDSEASIHRVVEEFRGAENTLIVRKDGAAIGEIHENTLLKVLIPEERLDEESVVGILGLSFDESFVPEKAEHVMNEHEVTVPMDEPLGEIAYIMYEEDVRAVPVEEDGEIKGVVHEDRVVEEL